MSHSTAQVFHVRQPQVGRTLANALREWLPGRSWSAVQKLLRTRHVQVNGNLCLDAGRRLKLAEVVRVLPQSAAPVPRSDDVRVRYLDEHVIVV
ncbi:MAG: S4 domain-containing protein, partial [Pirellulales bacterium]